MIIGVSGLNNTDNPAPGIPVAKSLYKNNEIIGLSYNANEPGNYQEIIKKSYLIPYPSQGYEELKHRLEILKDEVGIEGIIPNLDAELPLYISHQKQIEEDLGIKLCLPTLENFELRNKNKLTKISEDIGITYPEIIEVNSVQELEKELQKKETVVHGQLKEPLMIKGKYYKAYKVYNLNAAREKFYELSNEWGFPVLLQKVVIGEEINLVGVGDGKGNLSGAIAIKKLTTTDLGKIWTGITIKNERLMLAAENFMKQTKWKGPFELECMINGNDIYMIEINPRFPAWVYFATELEVNLPQMVVDIMDGKDIETKIDYPENKMYVRYVEERVVDFTEFIDLLSTQKLIK
jgi:carbamoyl-phosphate synthase large subunit